MQNTTENNKHFPLFLFFFPPWGWVFSLRYVILRSLIFYYSWFVLSFKIFLCFIFFSFQSVFLINGCKNLLSVNLIGWLLDLAEKTAVEDKNGEREEA